MRDTSTTSASANRSESGQSHSAFDQFDSNQLRNLPTKSKGTESEQEQKSRKQEHYQRLLLQLQAQMRMKMQMQKQKQKEMQDKMQQKDPSERKDGHEKRLDLPPPPVPEKRRGSMCSKDASPTTSRSIRSDEAGIRRADGLGRSSSLQRHGRHAAQIFN